MMVHQAIEGGELTMRHYIGNAILVPSIGFALFEEDSGRSVCHKSPVLHRTHGLLYQICETQ